MRPTTLATALFLGILLASPGTSAAPVVDVEGALACPATTAPDAVCVALEGVAADVRSTVEPACQTVGQECGRQSLALVFWDMMLVIDCGVWIEIRPGHLVGYGCTIWAF